MVVRDDAPTFDLPPGRRRAVLALAPLIDVTFILLIFFMLVTQFSRLGPVDVAIGELSSDPESPERGLGAPLQKQIDLIVHGDGTVDIAGRSGLKPADLAGVLAGERLVPAVSDSRIDSVEPARVLLIRPDRDVSLQLLLDVMHAIEGGSGYVTKLVTPARPEPEHDGR